jgi:hemerythrin
MSLEWKDSYQTGDAEIDAQHRSLFEDVAKVLAAKDRDGLLHCTLALIRNTQSHFDHEEKVMRKIGYPDINGHFKQHTDLMAKITVFSEGVAKGTVSNADVEQFVVGWLLGHIQTSDAKLTTYIWSFYPNWTS